jgi:hypothetical protein
MRKADRKKLGAFAVNDPPEETIGAPAISFRLPNTVIPSRYRIDYTTDLDRFSFNGTVAIQLDVKNATKRIVLHSRDLNIQSVRLAGVNGTGSSVAPSACVSNSFSLSNYLSPGFFLVFRGLIFLLFHRISFNSTYDLLIIDFAETLQPAQVRTCIQSIIVLAWMNLSNIPAPTKKNQFELSMFFAGKINDFLAGFYRSSYNDPKDGSLKWLAVTQFESIDARRAFPCFDEPFFKAVFEVSMAVRSGLTVISNTDPYAVEPVGNGWTVRFHLFFFFPRHAQNKN